MKKYFSIGETAKINNVSIQALRLYDKMGLLKPAYIDPETKYRYYTIDQFVYLDLIKYSKLIGAPLKELGEVLHNENIHTMLSFLKKQQRNVDKEIKRLKKISKGIDQIESTIKYAIELTERNKIYFRDITKRFIIDAELTTKDDIKDLEIELRKLDKIMEENEIMLGGETGYFIYLDKFLKHEKIVHKRLYSTICVDGNAITKVDIKEIPEGKFICIAYFNKEREDAVYKLRKYIEENNILTRGIGLETQLFNTLEQWQNDNVLFELQILI